MLNMCKIQTPVSPRYLIVYLWYFIVRVLSLSFYLWFCLLHVFSRCKIYAAATNGRRSKLINSNITVHEIFSKGTNQHVFFEMGFFSAVCSSAARLDGKTAVITGCNTGIGKVTAKDFFERGARVILACRNIEKANQAADDIKNCCKQKENLGELIVEELDLNSLKSVRNCAKNILEKEPKVDLLVNNAGIMTCPEGKTEDGFETQFGTNHLGHFLFTLLLLPKISQSTPARIVNLSSVAHERGTIDFDDLNWIKKPYSPMKAYGQSKLANILFTKELSKKLKENNITNVTVYSLHPGVIKTELGRHVSTTYGSFASFVWSLFSWAIKTPEQGAQTSIYCSVDEKCANESGLYYAECAVKKPSTAARNEETAKKLWDESLKLVGLPEDYNPFIKA